MFVFGHAAGRSLHYHLGLRPSSCTPAFAIGLRPPSSAILVSRSGRCSQVLHSFRRELERVQRDVSHLAHSEHNEEARQAARLSDLHAIAQGYSSPLARNRNSASSAADTLQRPPSAALMFTINTLLHSPSSKGQH